MSESKKRLLNFTWQGRGGGVQNALSFVEALNQLSKQDDYHVYARQGSEIATAAQDFGFECTQIPSKARQLHQFSLNCKKHFSAGQVCFTFFGPPWIGGAGYLNNVSGVAYSNLYYPELTFWQYYKGVQRAKRELTDRLRLWALSHADYWIFETQVLADRAVELGNYPQERVGVVRMTASSFVSPERVKEDVRKKYDSQIPKGFRFLFLAGAQRHKRIDRAADIAKKIKSLTDKPVVFVATLPQDARYLEEIKAAFQAKGVGDSFYNVGTCPYDDVASLIDACDSMCLFSTLESFSNNFVESWRMRKPLVATDADWSHSIVGDAGVYVDPEDAGQAAKEMSKLVDDPEHCARLVASGDTRLSGFPTVQQKCMDYLDHIDRAAELGIAGAASRKNIVKWRCHTK